MRKPLLILLALVTLFGVACGGDADPGDSPAATNPSPDTPTEDPTEPCEDQTGDDVVSVEMTDNAFEPTCIIANQSQGIHLENNGVVAHTFTVTVDFDITVEPGKEFDADGPLPIEPRDWVIRCKFHSGMLGALTVEA
jgi:hypothetical protein